MRVSIAATVLLLVLGGVAPVHAQALSARAPDPADVQTLDGILAAFYDIVSGPAGESRDWARDSTLYTADVRFVFQVGSGMDAAHAERSAAGAGDQQHRVDLRERALVDQPCTVGGGNGRATDPARVPAGGAALKRR